MKKHSALPTLRVTIIGATLAGYAALIVGVMGAGDILQQTTASYF